MDTTETETRNDEAAAAAGAYNGARLERAARELAAAWHEAIAGFKKANDAAYHGPAGKWGAEQINRLVSPGDLAMDTCLLLHSLGLTDLLQATRNPVVLPIEPLGEFTVRWQKRASEVAAALKRQLATAQQ